MALGKPSSPDPVYTPGTARGAKLAALLVDEGTALVRKIFEDEVKNMSPPSLREQLWKHKGYLYRKHVFTDKQGKNHKVNLNPGQKKTLYPVCGMCNVVMVMPVYNVPDTAQGFDISLLELLLKELVPLELGRDAPYSGERDRLRQFRNDNYGHRPRTDLAEEDFNKLWKELTEILVALGGDRDKISRMLNSSIDPELAAEHFALLDRLYKEDMEVKKVLDSLKEGQGSLKEGLDNLKEGQDSLKEGQDSLKEGQDGLKEGQDSLKEGQGSLQEGLDNLKEGQDSLKEAQDGLKEGQSSLKEGLEQLRTILDNLRATGNPNLGTSTKPRTESSCQTEQVHAGSPNVLANAINCLSGQHVDSSSGAGLIDLDVSNIIACLKNLYATEYGYVQPLPWCEDLKLHVGEVYTNLQLQQRDVSLADIYNIRKVRIEGGPGIGKSCSCQKLAYDWSHGKLDRFKVVLLLEMRYLAGKVKDAIFEQLLPHNTKVTQDQLWSYIQENQEDVLFILDGLDELSQAAREVTDVVDLIQGKILRNCHVLVTSRPYQCVKDLEKCHQFYKIVGYSRKKSEVSIHKYFRESPESALKLIEQIQSSSDLSEIVLDPLNNMIMCVVWEDNGEKLPSSKAELYEMIVHSVAKRFCTKIDLPKGGDKLPPDIDQALQCLGKLAWEGLEQEQLQFDIDEIAKKYGTTADNMLKMGLLTRIKRTCYCAFLHITFQEYMAARYISGLVMDGSSREEGMKCVCRLFGMSDAAVVNRKLIMSCHSKYGEVQNWLLLILGKNSRPLFARFEEELTKAHLN